MAQSLWMTIDKCGRLRSSGWRGPNLDAPKPHTFTCPVCKHQLRPQNVLCITCDNCGMSGSKQTFSAVVRRAA
jgi:hypothetical protein